MRKSLNATREYEKPICFLTFLRPLFALSLWLVWSPPAAADLAKQHQSFERLLLPGGRAALLGGAYTALANDPIGLLYNPGGSVFSEQNEVSINTWSAFRSEVVYDGAVQGEDFKESSQARSGGFAGGLFKHSPFTLGYLIASLDKRQINQDDYFTDLSAEADGVSDFLRVHQESHSYDLIGSSLGLSLGSSWGIGLLVYIYDRGLESMDFQKVGYNDGRILVQETKLKVSNQGLVAIAGIRYRGPTVSLGLSFKNGQAVNDEASLNFISVYQDQSGAPPTEQRQETDDYRAEEELIPTIIRLGWAWHPHAAFMLSTDVQYAGAIATENGSPDRLATFNYSLGIDTGFSRLRLLGGLFTNNSAFPRSDPRRTQQATHLNYLGQSMGLMLKMDSFDIAAGYIKQLGSGSAQITTRQATEKVAAIVEQFVVSWNFKLR